MTTTLGRLKEKERDGENRTGEKKSSFTIDRKSLRQRDSERHQNRYINKHQRPKYQQKQIATGREWETPAVPLLTTKCADLNML